MESQDSLIKPNYFEILYFIKENQPCKKSEVYDHLGGPSNSRTKSVNDLIKLDLIEESRRGQYNLKLITITTKGEKILEQIIKLQAIIDDEPIEPETNCGAPSEETGSSMTAE